MRGPADEPVSAGPLTTAERTLGAIAYALVGSNPWPAAGPWGRFAAAILPAGAAGYLAWMALDLVSNGPTSSFSSPDFVSYFSGATIVARGQGHYLYDAALQHQTVSEILAGIGLGQAPIVYLSPPLFAALLVPLLPFGLLGSVWFWRVLTLALSGGALLAVAGWGGLWSASTRASLLLLGFLPFVSAWQWGQMVGILLLSFGGWLALSRSGCPRLAGLMLSLTLLKPQYALVPVMYLVWKRQWKHLLGWTVGALLQAALSVALLLGDRGLGPLEVLWSFALSGNYLAAEFVQQRVNLRSAITGILPGLGAREHWLLLSVATVAVVAAFLKAAGSSWRRDGRALAWEALALSAVMNLTALHNHTSGLVLLLPPAAALLADHRPDSGGHRGLQEALLAILIATPSLGTALVVLTPSAYSAAHWVTLVGAMALGLWGSAIGLAPHRSATPGRLAR